MLLRPAPRRRLALAPASILFALAILQGCASTPRELACSDPQNDPYESFNRHVLAFDLGLDRIVIKPAARAYRAVLPEFVRDRIHAFLGNLKEPIVFANDVLQGRGHSAGLTGGRFIVNSTIGLAGFFDRATPLGLPRQSGDFGQTLFAWGLGDGPYLVLPLFGPSNVRDAVGLGVDSYASPVGRIGGGDVPLETSLSTGVTNGLDLRSRNIEAFQLLQDSSLDLYATLRSITRQRRQAVLNHAKGSTAEGDGAPDDELDDPGAMAAPRKGSDGARAAEPCPPPPAIPASAGTPASQGTR